jgi:hypothetical protein
MTTTLKDGGPAFPYQANDARRSIRNGMTLRDWFAGQCMHDTFAALAAAGWANFNEYQLRKCAEASYQAADAMIAARNAYNNQAPVAASRTDESME